MLNSILFLLSLCCASTLEQAQWTGEVAGQLFRDKFLNDSDEAKLLKEIHPQVPRADNKLKLVTVTLGYKHIAVTNVDESNGYISISAWEMMSWNDSRLMWDEKEYPGLTCINLLPEYIWMPDIVFYTASSTKASYEEGVKALVLSSGQVSYVTKQDMTFHCSMDLTNFPYDVQVCSVDLASCMDQSQEFHLSVAQVSHLTTQPHTDWIITASSITNSTAFSMSPFGLLESVKLTLQLVRKTGFHKALYLYPATIITFILPVIHLFPSGGSQKTTIAGLIMICTVLLYQDLCQQLRGFDEDNTPKILHHYGNLIILLVTSVAVSAITSLLASSNHSSRRLPSPIRAVLNSVAGRVCCLGQPQSKALFEPLEEEDVTFNTENDMATIVNHSAEIAGHAAPKQPEAVVLQPLITELRYARERKQVEMEWCQLAILVDRIAVIVFLVFALASTFRV
ncbi:neuronal acetylcholine receptor subunit alpha-7-like [Watersipora subatra]|uniref:neuronal acetylcholine receptor subunit alpha-7-like n=1 Tax=Watersipora subatra TaxID=2589382 RepID=UPI00355BED2B